MNDAARQTRQPQGPPWLTGGLLALCVLVHLAGELAEPETLRAWHLALALSPPGSPQFHVWQPLSYGLLHGSWLHLGFNMLGLWVFGAELERRFGALWTVEVFGASVLWAAIAHVILSPWLGQPSSLVGASGGLYGLLVAYSVAFPDHRLPLLPGVEVGARTFAACYAGLELYLMFPSALPGAALFAHFLGNMSHLAHLGGMAGGLMLAQGPARDQPARPRGPNRS